MPQIGTADVTYTAVEGTGFASPSDPQAVRTWVVAFGDGTLTYTNGGIPLSKAKLGCPSNLAQLIMMDSGNTVGYVPKWNMTANTVRLYQDGNVTAAAGAALTEVITSAAVTAMTLRVLVKGY
jgi:hypothetical protein